MKSDVVFDTGASEEKTLAKKNELIVWLKLTSCQVWIWCHCYETFLELLINDYFYSDLSLDAEETIWSFSKKWVGSFSVAAKGITVGCNHSKNNLQSLFFIMMLLTFLCLWGWGVACSLIEKLAVACLLMRLCSLHYFTLFSATDIEENMWSSIAID